MLISIIILVFWVISLYAPPPLLRLADCHLVPPPLCCDWLVLLCCDWLVMACSTVASLPIPPCFHATLVTGRKKEANKAVIHPVTSMSYVMISEWDLALIIWFSHLVVGLLLSSPVPLSRSLGLGNKRSSCFESKQTLSGRWPWRQTFFSRE